MVVNVSNPAAEQGWVKSKDPKSGRVFYANHVTRKTQWDPPVGWREEQEEQAPAPFQQEQRQQDQHELLPSNWEVLHDPSTGKPFYIDHERKITTWTRPTGTATTNSRPSATNNNASSSSSTSRSNAFQRILSSSAQQQQQKEQQAQRTRSSVNQKHAAAASSSYGQTQHYNRSYPHHSHHHQHYATADVDFSDALPSVDFKVKEVPDKYRDECPHCETPFSISKRRHHCRLCGDIFCDACSLHRVELPLEGAEFEKPVRVCDYCHDDVNKGNFFSMRRYLTPLILYEPATTSHDYDDDNEQGGVATATHVKAALCALTVDLDSCLQNASSFAEKMTIPPHVLVPAICKHLTLRTTSDYAIRALASLLAVTSIVQETDYAHAVYLYGGAQTMSDILALLERSGSDRKTLFVQEQAARAMFYLTDASILATLEAKQEQLQHQQSNRDNATTNEDSDEDNQKFKFGGVESLDMDRTLRNMLDHSSVSKNPALQRWSAASIRNLVVEDQRRACMATNDVAAELASGQGRCSLGYESFLDQLVSTGGIMILCSLVGADDGDTRAHATGALGAVLASTRAIDASLVALSEMTGSSKPTPGRDGDIIRAIVTGGGCGSSISQLLLSADNAVAAMGCDFVASLVMPLLEDARASATLPSNYNCEYDNEGLGACREAALAVCTGSCLPALLSLAKDSELGSRVTRPMKLRKRAMETLAAVVMAVGQMAVRSESNHARVMEAVSALTAEDIVSVALAIMDSSSSQSLLSTSDNPALRIREAAGIILSSMTQCSPEALEELQCKGALSSLLAAASDKDMMAASSVRGDAAPLCLGSIQASAAILTSAWEKDDKASSQLLDRLLEAIDAGVISIMTRIFFTKMDWESQDKSAGSMKAREACCRMLCAMFGIARNDDTGIGQVRLYSAVDAAAYSQKPLRNVVTATLGTLQTSANYARRALMGGGIQAPHYHAALMDLVESSLLAAGSMCGSQMAPGDADFDSKEANPASDDDFKPRRQHACSVACNVLVHRGRQGPLLPTMLVGGFGEPAVNASLRLALTIAEHGSQEEHAKLAKSGILVPIGDSLRNALSTGDLYKFSASLALVRFCGPHVAAGEGGGLQSVQDAIRVATNVLTLPADPNADIGQIGVQETLKSECISTLEALSKNASLWSAISKDALPAIVSYLHGTCATGHCESACRHDTRVIALKAVLRLVQLPSHAVAASQAGIVEPLANLMKTESSDSLSCPPEDDDIPLLALEIMHVLVSNREARHHARLLQSGVFQSVCRALGNAATDKPNKPSDTRADIAFWGLEILHFVLLDAESSGDFAEVLQSSIVKDIVDTVSLESNFVKALCATLLSRTGMKIPSAENDGDGYEIPRLYGPPLVLVKESCAGFDNSHLAAVSLLFNLAVYACAIETSSSESLWKTLLLMQESSGADSEDATRLSATLCAELLSFLSDGNRRSLASTTERKRENFENISRPLVQHRLLDGLKSCLDDQSDVSVVPGMSNCDPYMCSLLVAYEVPQICLTLWRDQALIDAAFELIKLMVDEYHDEVLALFVQSKSSMRSLFDMLTFGSSADNADVNVEEFRRLVASILGSLAQEGILNESVDRFDVRSSAIAALAAACLAEDDVALDENEDAPATSSRMSSRCMQCLVELCTVESDEALHHRQMRLSQSEAEAITHSLGRKICQMVTSRFLERAKLEQYDVTTDDDIMDAPDVAMLCAVAQHESSLQILRSVGGLHALCLIASEGDLSAINAIYQASIEESSLILDVDGHKSIMAFLGEDSRQSRDHLPDLDRQIETLSFNVLTQLCNQSKNRSVVLKAEDFDACVLYAMQIESSMMESVREDAKPTETEDESPSYDAELFQSTDDDNELSEDDAEPVDPTRSDPAAEDSNFPKPSNDEESTPTDASSLVLRPIENASLEVAAFEFLSSLLSVAKCRSTLLQDPGFIRASLAIGKCCPVFELKSGAVRFLVRFSPYSRVVHDEVLAFSPSALMEVFRETLHLDTSRCTSPEAKVNLVQNVAMEGAETLFDQVPSAFQCSVIAHVVERFLRLEKSAARPSKGEVPGVGLGSLACSLTLLMLRSIGNNHVDSLLFANDLLTGMIHLVQWRVDPKLRSCEQQDALQWDAAVGHCLQLIAFVFRQTNERLDEAGVTPVGLARTVLMISRPGKAPRKAIDFKSALLRMIDPQSSSNASAVVAAQRILRSLQD